MGLTFAAAWVGCVAALSTTQRVTPARCERRSFLGQALVGSAGLAALVPAARGGELSQLKTGYDGIVYLLDNWDSETIKSCPKEQVALAAECERNPDKIPTALGLRSTTAPLYKIEKLFTAALQNGDVEDIDEWTNWTDSYIQHSTSAQEYAYTASFGEYNPSGGKDQVAKYMELSRKELLLARDALKEILLQLGYESKAL
mmetsp:Transcript_17455/g.54527  ORF Transcript_17455/g.54527 Transcript_17455/m.54527 type:complete len:201 (+) Transcript_17455:22-624(+)